MAVIPPAFLNIVFCYRKVPKANFGLNVALADTTFFSLECGAKDAP